MKRSILVLMFTMIISLAIKAQIPSAPANSIIVMFGEGGKSGELYFNGDTQTFQGGWISYPVLHGGGLYYMLPVNSVSGQLIGTLLEEPEEIEDPIPMPISFDFSHFEGTIYYGSGSEWGNLVLHSGNNAVLQ